MTPGLCLDSGEFIPAAELNRRIEMKKLSDRALQSLRNAGNEYEEAADEIEALRSRIAELEAQLEKGKQLCREQTATIVDRTKTFLDLEANLASGQEPVGVLFVGTYYGESLDDWEFQANRSMCDALNEAYAAKGKYGNISLYTHPAPAQKPLNRDQILDLYQETDPLCSLFTFRDIVADIEAKHGIKEKP